MNKGFTLIELLVVVLILGVLSAIALPQYEAAVEKSRTSEALVNTKAIVDAMERFYQQWPDGLGPDGELLTFSPASMDVDLKGGGWSGNTYTTKLFTYEISGNSVKATRIDSGDSLYSISRTLDMANGTINGQCINLIGDDDITNLCNFVNEVVGGDPSQTSSSSSSSSSGSGSSSSGNSGSYDCGACGTSCGTSCGSSCGTSCGSYGCGACGIY